MGVIRKLFFTKSVTTVEPGHKDPFNQLHAAINRLRRGMWVVVKSSARPVGIITAISDEGVARVMLTDKRGENRLEVDVPAMSVVQARWVDIPPARRPSRAAAMAYGYAVGREQ